MGLFDKLFGKGVKKSDLPTPKHDESDDDDDYEAKVAGLEHVLGKMNSIVGHAVIPFDLGGAVDMYYFSNHISGTGFATMELLDKEGNGPKPNMYGTYELLAFTKHPFNRTAESPTPFDLEERRVCGIFTTIGNYSFDAVLNPGETCEIPDDDGTKYLIFDIYQPNGRKFKVGDRMHHLLLCIEVFKTEIEFAREQGGFQLLERMKNAKYYPYSDLDRLPVV